MLGYLPHLPEVQLESRHLGLMTAGEVEQLDEKIRLLGETAAETLELSRILELAKTAPPLPDVPQYTAKPKRSGSVWHRIRRSALPMRKIWNCWNNAAQNWYISHR